MNIKRMRGRNNRGGGGGFRNYQSGGTPLNRNHVFDSNGPEQRVRGTAQQLYDKYQQLGRDASGAGDRVLAESYFQYAEHYFRIISAMNQAAQAPHGNGHARRGDAQSAEAQDDAEPAEGAPGLGEQPPTEAREIPISAAPPEA